MPAIFDELSAPSTPDTPRLPGIPNYPARAGAVDGSGRTSGTGIPGTQSILQVCDALCRRRERRTSAMVVQQRLKSAIMAELDVVRATYKDGQFSEQKNRLAPAYAG